MTKPSDIYQHCDELDSLPALNRQNYLFELDLLIRQLPKNASVLQVGCMDGTRIIRLHTLRPDLQITGLDIDETLLEIARENFKRAKMDVQTLLIDITNPVVLSIPTRFDVVLCLNNTLGYIDDEKTAIAHMRALGKEAIISVYGEAFTDETASAYFSSMGLIIDDRQNDTFYLRDFGSVRRFTKINVTEWGGEITTTSLGYFCMLKN